ncbi:hypothetical protein BpHYR1_001057 [Brachionus plicatilis]|uniref:Uncharacterized protein n=1 Tax=Brachionus plicatilis TaxID=10195 RepID=A0A3M7QML0_BRAPC|nr:hypothetical protein BpHYR1_001057 [Brachionus plicatilis]
MSYIAATFLTESYNRFVVDNYLKAILSSTVPLLLFYMVLTTINVVLRRVKAKNYNFLSEFEFTHVILVVVVVVRPRGEITRRDAPQSGRLN